MLFFDVLIRVTFLISTNILIFSITKNFIIQVVLMLSVSTKRFGAEFF
jgi:hypothetical protein